MFKKRLHVFKAGPQVSAQGIERKFTSQDLQEVVDSYNPNTHEAPLVIGHSGDNDSAPSFGWIEKFERDGNDLYADVNFTDTAKDLVKKGHYRKVSISFYSPTSPINPHKGRWSARHLALLGASPPAVKGLEPFSFSERDGVFDFATALSPDTIFDKELGPTMIIEKNPLEILKERLEEVRGQINDSLEDLKKSQETQAEANVGAQAEAAPADTPGFAEKRRKKMGLEGTEASDASAKLANLETMSPDDQYGEGVSRKMKKGEHGHEVQLVQETFEESEDRKVAKGKSGHKVQVVQEVFKEGKKGCGPKNVDRHNMTRSFMGLPMMDEDEYEEHTSRRKAKGCGPKNVDRHNMTRSFMGLPLVEEEEYEEHLNRKKAKGAHGHEVQVVQEVFEEDGDEFTEDPGHKSTSDGKVSFGHHKSKRTEDVAGRGLTGRSKSDSYGARQSVGEGEEDGRDETSDDDGDQDDKRQKTAKNSDQDRSRGKLAKVEGNLELDEGRWADQPERQKVEVSSGKEPHGRDGGPTEFPTLMDEEPFNQEFAVDLESTRGNRTVRVIHQKSSDKRASAPGKEIPSDAKEEFVEGVSHKVTKNGKVSFGYHGEPELDDPEGRRKTAKHQKGDNRTAKGFGSEEDRDGVIDDDGGQEEDRVSIARSDLQDDDRTQLTRALMGFAGDAESRWEGQPGAKAQVMNNDQFDDGEDDLPEVYKPETVKMPELVDEYPSNKEVVTPLKNVKGAKSVRVMYQDSDDGRAPLKGGRIEYAEGEADGLTREPAKAKVSAKKDAMGRSGGPTDFPEKSEEDPDTLEMAVDLEDATKSNKVRIVRQKAGDAPTLDHKEKAKTPMTRTGKGSTYGQKTPVLVEEEDGEVEFGMGSLGQAKALGYPSAMFEELKTLKEENDRLKQEYEGQKIRARKNKIAEFVENLYVSGKLTDGIIPQRELQNYCEGLEFGTLEFSEGQTPVSTLFTLLDRLPNLVYFGEVVSNAEYKEPEDEDADPHEKAMKMVAKGEAPNYVEAIKLCLWGSQG